MKIANWPRIFSWPTYSDNALGRSARSIASSCGEAGSAAIRRSVSMAMRYFTRGHGRCSRYPEYRAYLASVRERAIRVRGVADIREKMDVVRDAATHVLDRRNVAPLAIDAGVLAARPGAAAPMTL